MTKYAAFWIVCLFCFSSGWRSRAVVPPSLHHRHGHLLAQTICGHLQHRLQCARVELRRAFMRDSEGVPVRSVVGFHASKRSVPESCNFQSKPYLDHTILTAQYKKFHIELKMRTVMFPFVVLELSHWCISKLSSSFLLRDRLTNSNHLIYVLISWDSCEVVRFYWPLGVDRIGHGIGSRVVSARRISRLFVLVRYADQRLAAMEGVCIREGVHQLRLQSRGSILRSREWQLRSHHFILHGSSRGKLGGSLE